MPKKVTEKEYQTWRSTLPKGLQYEGDYDLRGYYEKYRKTDMAANGHLTDEFKLPNHPTLSNESQYFMQAPQNAGHWEEKYNGPKVSDMWVPFNPAVKDTVIEERLKHGGIMKNKISKKQKLIKAITGAVVDPWQTSNTSDMGEIAAGRDAAYANSAPPTPDPYTPKPIAPQEIDQYHGGQDTTEENDSKVKVRWHNDIEGLNVDWRHPSFNTANALNNALGLASAALPDLYKPKNNLASPTMGEQRDAYGVKGSGATFAEGGVMPLSEQDKSNWNAFHANMARTNSNYGTDTLDHGRTGEAAMQQWNAAHPGQAVNRPVTDYQQEFTTTPMGRSGTDNYLGKQTAASSFKAYEYTHLDKNGNTIGHIDPTFNPMTQGQMDGWSDNNRKPQWASNSQGSNIDGSTGQPAAIPTTPTPIAKPLGLASNGFPTREEAIAKYKAKKTAMMGEYGLDMDSEDFGYDEAAAGVTMLGAGQMAAMSDIPNPTYLFKGPSHADDGIPLEYGGSRAEVQGGETGKISSLTGALVVDGAMKMPNLGEMTKGLAGRTFQAIGKERGEAEAKASKMGKKAAAIAEAINPRNPFDTFANGTAIALNSASNQDTKALQAQALSTEFIQNVMRDHAEENGVDNKKAHTLFGKNGLSINRKADAGDNLPDKDKKPETTPMVYKYDNHGGRAFDMEKANRLGYNGPANTKKFQDFLNENYPDQVKAAGVGGKTKKWADGIWGKRTDSIVDSIHPKVNTQLPALEKLNPMPPHPDVPMQRMGAVPLNDVVDTTRPVDKAGRHYSSLAQMNKLNLTDFLPAAKYLLDQPDPVPTGQINPSLKSPYQVSFQDRINNNNATLRAISQAPRSMAELAAAAAGTYDANNAVSAEEFRVNQGIANQTSNDNIGIMNETQKANTMLNMEQLKNQSIAKSNTEAHKAQSLAWISDKVAQNRHENMNIAMVEMRSGFRPYKDENGNLQLEYKGPNAFLNGSPGGTPYGTDGWNYTQEKNDGGQWEDSKRTRKATAKWGGMFGKKKGC